MGGTGDYHFEAVDFQGIMRNFLTRVAKILPSTVTFRSDQAAGSCLVVCDNNLLESVLENLVINAVNAMPGGGRIEIRWGLSEDGGQVFVEICDSGPGLPDAVLAALEGGTPPASSGRPGRIGLGLVNARRIIVRLHGGQLKLERLAEGSRVAIVLPLAPWSAEVA